MEMENILLYLDLDTPSCIKLLQDNCELTLLGAYCRIFLKIIIAGLIFINLCTTILHICKILSFQKGLKYKSKLY